VNTLEFVALSMANTKRTANVRTGSHSWEKSGVYRLPDNILNNFGRVVALLQAQVDIGLFCKKDEHLLIYNFQILQEESDDYYCSLDIVIKPNLEIDNTHVINGLPLHLVINGTSGEVMNTIKGLIAFGIEPEDGEVPISFGSYNEYSALDKKENEKNNNESNVQGLLLNKFIEMQAAWQVSTSNSLKQIVSNQRVVKSFEDFSTTMLSAYSNQKLLKKAENEFISCKGRRFSLPLFACS